MLDAASPGNPDHFEKSGPVLHFVKTYGFGALTRARKPSDQTITEKPALHPVDEYVVKAGFGYQRRNKQSV